MIQHQSKVARVLHESYLETKRVTMPLNRVPSLAKIVEQFESGRPVDQSQVRSLEFNDFENMPIYSKGFDIIDAYKLSKRNGQALDEMNAEIEDAINKASKPQPTRNPAEESPTNLNES